MAREVDATSLLTFSEEWTQGSIVDCGDDCESCFIVSVLPCIAFSENRRMLHGGVLPDRVDPCFIYCLIAYLTSGFGCCLYAYSTRTDIRTKYNLKPEPCNDCCVHLLCHCCAMCQEYRELKSRPITPWPMPVGMNQASQTVTGQAIGLAYQQPVYSGEISQSGFIQIAGPPLPPPQPLTPQPAVYSMPSGGSYPYPQPMYPPSPQVTTVPPSFGQPKPPSQAQPFYVSRPGFN